MVSPVSSGRHSLSSSGDAGVGKVASLRSYGGSRNPRSLDTDMKVNCDTSNTGWEKFKPAPDPISEGNDGSGNISHASSSPTIFKSYTAFDLGLKEEAQATQGERTRRKFASVQMKFDLSPGASNKTISHVTSSAIKHPAFDAFFAVVVFANAIFTGIEVESSISGSILSDAQIRMSHYIFFGLFTIELIARVSLYGRRFFWSDDWLWNWLDVTIVASSFAEIIVDIMAEQQAASGEFEGRNPMSGLKVFRIIRLTRLVKTIRLVRIFRFVVALRTLVTSILHTLKALFWALTLLGLIVYVFAVLFAQAVYDHKADPEMPDLSFEEDRAAIRYFGSLPETMLSLFMSIAGGVSWQEVLRPLKAMDLTWVFLFLFYAKRHSFNKIRLRISPTEFSANLPLKMRRMTMQRWCKTFWITRNRICERSKLCSANLEQMIVELSPTTCFTNSLARQLCANILKVLALISPMHGPFSSCWTWMEVARLKLKSS